MTMPYSYHPIKSSEPSPVLLSFASHHRPSWIPSKICKVVSALAVVLILLTGLTLPNRARHTLANYISQNDFAHSVTNSTLGFEKIFVLSLPDRGDRRSVVVGAANITNLTIAVLDAVRDKEIKDSEKPKDWGNDHREGELGCLMSHVRTWSKMIEENTTTALIMESDADWDMRIRSSMPGLATAAKTLIDYPFPDSYIPPSSSSSNTSTKPHPGDLQNTHPNRAEPSSPLSPPSRDPADSFANLSPYGPKWDILWLGHCGASSPGNARLFTYFDPTAPSSSRAHILKEGLDTPSQRPEGNGTRVVFEFGKATCTAGYAISLQGAKKLVGGAFGEGELGYESVRGVKKQPVDKWMARVCLEDVGMSCLGVWPQVVSQAVSESNIGGNDEEKKEEEKEKDRDDERAVRPGQGIQISARVNAYEGRREEERWKLEWLEE